VAPYVYALTALFLPGTLAGTQGGGV